MIKKISLTNFRNYKKSLFDFDKDITVIVGPNASGKTNILEALHFLSTGKSFRAAIEAEVIKYASDVSRIKGKVEVGFSEDFELEIVLTRGMIRMEDKMDKSPKKRVFVNGVAKRVFDFAGIFKTVLFGPWDLDLVTESPSVRRNFLDGVLSQVDREYRRSLMSYEKGLRQRNKLLKRIRDERLPRTQLLFWNKVLIKNGNYITEKRRELIDFINENPEMDGVRYHLEYDLSTISQSRLDNYANQEVYAATTLVGPHRDDFKFLLEGKESRDLSKFGSRGEQRMVVLWLKLAELAFIQKMSNQKPTLLLDDIFSELDTKHRQVVLDVSKNQQTIISTADVDFVEEGMGLRVIKLN